MAYEVVRLSRAFLQSPGFIDLGRSESICDPDRRSGTVVSGPHETESEASAVAAQLAANDQKDEFVFFIRLIYQRSTWAAEEVCQDCERDSTDVTPPAPKAPDNDPPVVDAGADLSISLPNLASLQGVVTDDGEPNGTLLISWSKISGPGDVAFTDSSDSETTVSFSVAGTYVLRLFADDTAKVAFDTATITVTGQPNDPPVVDAGTNQTILLPNTAALVGTASDDGVPNGILITTWSKISGPGVVTFADENALSTTASFSTVGTYVLQLEADDTELQTTDTVEITAQVNLAPIVDAGLDQLLDFPDAATLVGTASDDGLPSGTLVTTWSKISGPGTVVFADENSLNTTATFSTAGAYVLQLEADDGALQATDTVQITLTSGVGSSGFLGGGTESGTTSSSGFLGGGTVGTVAPGGLLVAGSNLGIADPGGMLVGGTNKGLPDVGGHLVGGTNNTITAPGGLIIGGSEDGT